MEMKIRAHHLLCIPRFYSGGYNKKFAENMKKKIMQIRKNPNLKIKLISGKTDVLCDKCPHRKKTICTQGNKMGKWVVTQDKKVLRYLKLKQNSIHKAKNVFNLSMEKINNKNNKDFCGDCVFSKNCIRVDINNSFKDDLNNKK